MPPDTSKRVAVEPPEPTGSRPAAPPDPALLQERGGPAGPEPTRFGDWERKGRCVDF